MRRVGRWLSALLPPVVWLAVITLWSGNLGSHDHVTHWVIARLAHWFPGLVSTSEARYRVAGALWDARKPAHLFEYAVLALLVYRALGLLAGLARRRRVIVSVACCGIVGALDELHQSLNPARTPLPTDALIDLAGGAVGLALRAAGKGVRHYFSRRAKNSV